MIYDDVKTNASTLITDYCLELLRDGGHLYASQMTSGPSSPTSKVPHKNYKAGEEVKSNKI
jgi:hypothetical protein